MKKITIAAALLLTTGILTSCSKQAPVKPTATIEQSTVSTKKDVGTAD
ncbi:hypothetical protein [Mucilaginibacter glaciei]|uniref:Uncharacterized protein n=1 Tax=Mucilaginibacter glaciei TaxID=2772109 RepID=A0A926NTG7_9SPHI|nr:hypothetical protein [Mucilaginibacter glaciei]MBD1391468.1 hypothetical protein [Mucilaginibacter glaciei]